MGIFVGAERHAIVDDLVAQFTATADDAAGVRVVVLASPPGWGKTRIVQAFYERLAAEQTGPRYWPEVIESTDGSGMAAVMQGRKRIYPHQVDVAAGASMPWMWWGVLCHSRQNGEWAQAWSDDATQVWAHADAILNKTTDKAGRAFDATGALIGLVGLAGLAVAPPVGLVVTVGGALRTGWANKDLTSQLEAWRQRRRGRTLDAAVGDGSDRAVEMAEKLAQIARNVPVVLVVDDAHDADETLTGLIAHLATEVPTARVLVVATAWPQALDAKTNESPFARWLESSDPERVTRIDLSPLGTQDLHAIAIDDLTGGDPIHESEETAKLAAMVVERVNGNPLGVRALLRLEEVQDALDRGNLSEHDLAMLPGDLDSIFHEYWKQLPREVRQVLERGAYLGTAYVPPVVVAAAIADGIDTAAEAALRGVHPYAWVRPLNDDLAHLLHTFVDPLLHERARHEAQRLTPQQRGHLHQQVVTAAIDAALATDQPDQVRATLWQHHVTLTREGLTPADDHAAHSATQLAIRAADTFEYTLAIALGSDALAWSTEPADRPDALYIRSLLAKWYALAGRTNDAIATAEAAIRDCEQVLGPDQRDTLNTRSLLANSYALAGRIDEGIATAEALLNDQLRILDRDHPDTLATRSLLASLYGPAGRIDEGITTAEALLNDQLRILDRDHPDTLATRSFLVGLYVAAGRTDEGITTAEALLGDEMRDAGTDDPFTVVTQLTAAMANAIGGPIDDAITTFEAAVRDLERLRGPDHLATLKMRSSLAHLYGEAERTDEAIATTEALLNDQLRILDPYHPDTLTTRSLLANMYVAAERTDEGITTAEALLNDQLRILGPNHPDTLKTRLTLAWLNGIEGRTEEAVTATETLLHDQVRVLGRDHPDALTTRVTLADLYGKAGRTDEAIPVTEAVLNDQVRILGPHHADTVATRFQLAHQYADAGRDKDFIAALGSALDAAEAAE